MSSRSNAEVLRSEFATVRVVRDDAANGPRLLVEDVRSGRSIHLDPLELEWIAWSSHAELARLWPSFAGPGAAELQHREGGRDGQ